MSTESRNPGWGACDGEEHELLLSLDDPAAMDPGTAGAKAALLARARAAGLPVLPGVVVPAFHAAATLTAARAALTSSGSGGARLSAMAVEVDPALVRALGRRTGALSLPLIVRSSGVTEGDAHWSGAFSSFCDIGMDDLATALRGVWASAFAPHALDRAEATGTDPAGAGLAVLVQPQVTPSCSGTARVGPSGVVDIVATTGPTSLLLHGWERGVRARVGENDHIDGHDAVGHVGGGILLEVAALARQVRALLDCELIEWGEVDGHPLLLQLSAAPLPPARQAPATPAALDHPLAMRVARLAVRHPGPLGEALVLPWALASEVLPQVSSAPASVRPLEDLQAASGMAAELTAQVWQQPAQAAATQTARLLRDLRGPEPDPALEQLRALRPVEPAQAVPVLSLLAGIVAAAATQTPLFGHNAAWSLDVEELGGLFATGAIPHRITAALGPDRWEPFVHAAVATHGRQSLGDPAAPGIAAGVLLAVTDVHAPGQPGRRPVVVAHRPVPALSPLLWSAAALVTTSGNAGAHLIEVARSLGVPAVVHADLAGIACDLADIATGPALLAAVDGDRGAVSIVEA